jgi:hypothetical protein
MCLEWFQAKGAVMSKRMFEICAITFILLFGCTMVQQKPGEEPQVQKIAQWDPAPFQLAYSCGKMGQQGNMPQLTSDCNYLAENWLKGWVVGETKTSHMESISTADFHTIYGRCEHSLKHKIAFNQWCHERVLLVAWLCGENDYSPDVSPERQQACNEFVIYLQLQ